MSTACIVLLLRSEVCPSVHNACEACTATLSWPARAHAGRYLGLYATEIEAAQAYDRESVARRGLEAVTNFDLGEYLHLLSAQVCWACASPAAAWALHRRLFVTWRRTAEEVRM